jgi:hypothetical protein
MNKFESFFQGIRTRLSSRPAPVIYPLLKPAEKKVRVVHAWRILCWADYAAFFHSANYHDPVEVEKSTKLLLACPAYHKEQEIDRIYKWLHAELAEWQPGEKPQDPAEAAAQKALINIKKQLVSPVLNLSLQATDHAQTLTKDGWNKTLDKDGKTEYWLNHHHPDYLIVIANNQFTIRKKGNKIVHPTSALSDLKKVLSEKKADGTLPGSITNSR